MSVDLNIIDKLVIKYFAFVRYWVKMGVGAELEGEWLGESPQGLHEAETVSTDFMETFASLKS
jgi:hypothetical protein